jgi:single-strand DNA-binding protein
MNNAMVIGNLVADPEVITTTTGKQVANLRIAVNGSRKNTPVTFMDVKAWQGTAEFVSRNFAKGAPIAITGEIRQDSWTNKEGQNRSRLYILANRVGFAGGRQRQAA